MHVQSYLSNQFCSSVCHPVVSHAVCQSVLGKHALIPYFSDFDYVLVTMKRLYAVTSLLVFVTCKLNNASIIIHSGQLATGYLCVYFARTTFSCLVVNTVIDQCF